MARKQDPAILIVEWFRNAPLETTGTVLAIVKDIYKRRQPVKTAKPRVLKAPGGQAVS